MPNETSTPVGATAKEDRIAEKAALMMENGVRAQKQRFAEIQKNEDMYFGKSTPALKGRSNIPFDTVLMRGYVDTAVANSAQEISLSFGRTREQDKLSADKISAVWERESGPDRGNWGQHILDSKLLAGLGGRAFLKLVVESVPKFDTDLSTPDYFDMVVDPNGGGYLDKHMFKFERNIFRTSAQLKGGAADGFYNKGQARKLIATYTDPVLQKKVQDELSFKKQRMTNLGVDIDLNGYVGQRLYNLTEGVINIDGKWMYIVEDMLTKIWVRIQPLEEVFEHAKIYPGRGAWVSWATHRHPHVFWSPGPSDDVRPIGYTMKKIVDLTVDNLEKRNWDRTAYDPKVFTDPAQLLYRQDGLVRATLKQNQSIASGLFQFQTPDTTGVTINMVEWLNSFLGRESGITPDARGGATSDKVGIVMSNMEQVSKRMSLQNTMFKQALVDLGVIFDYGVNEHLREPYAVKIIGAKGARWSEDVTRDDTDCDFSVHVRSKDEEERKNIISAAKRQAGYAEISKNPAIMGRINQQWYLTERLRDMGYDDEQIRVALDTNNDGDDDSRAKAAQAIQDCLDNKELYLLHRDATPAFIEKILDFCDDAFEIVPDGMIRELPPSKQRRYKEQMKKYDKLIEYAKAHISIAQKNMMRKAVSTIAQMRLSSAAPASPGAAPAAVPGMPVTPAPGAMMAGAMPTA